MLICSSTSSGYLLNFLVLTRMLTTNTLQIFISHINVSTDSCVLNNSGLREDATKIIILLTDGVQNPKKYDPAAVAKKLLSKGYIILVVGISPEIDEAELEAIAGYEHNVFYGDSFDELDSFQFVDQITGTVCPGTD